MGPLNATVSSLPSVLQPRRTALGSSSRLCVFLLPPSWFAFSRSSGWRSACHSAGCCFSDPWTLGPSVLGFLDSSLTTLPGVDMPAYLPCGLEPSERVPSPSVGLSAQYSFPEIREVRSCVKTGKGLLPPLQPVQGGWLGALGRGSGRPKQGTVKPPAEAMAPSLFWFCFRGLFISEVNLVNANNVISASQQFPFSLYLMSPTPTSISVIKGVQVGNYRGVK